VQEYQAETGSISFFKGNGDGTLQPHTDLVTGPSPSSLAMADLNGDGKLDVVTANPGMGPYSVSVLLNVSMSSGTPNATLTPASVKLPRRSGGGVSPPMTFTLTNTGTATLQSISPMVTGTNASEFPITGETCASTLMVGSSCTINVSFAPTGINTRTATLTV